MGRIQANKAVYRNGWIVGPFVAIVTAVTFLGVWHEDRSLTEQLLLVGIPIAIVAGAVVGLLVEGEGLARKRRETIGFSILVGFIVYIALLILYLASRT